MESAASGSARGGIMVFWNMRTSSVAGFPAASLGHGNHRRDSEIGEGGIVMNISYDSQKRSPSAITELEL
jgi:hypothetical protein